MGIVSVLYLIIPKIANKPKAKLNSNFTFSSKKHKKKTTTAISK